MSDPLPVSVPGICQATVLRGATAPPTAPPDLLVEVPHGATKARHYEALRAALKGPFPEGLSDFFFVNTDVGAPEVAHALARRLVAADPRRTVLVLACEIPRTFVDCNRLIDESARAASPELGGMTPGLPAYIRDPDDRRLLWQRYDTYRAAASAAYDITCDPEGGLALMLHSYAPREVDVPVDDRIVERLREAYRPELLSRWPLRSEVDLIARTPDGTLLASERLLEEARAAFAGAGFDVTENRAYGLHPSTLAHALAARHPGRTLCVEMRRDLLAKPFTPFAEMAVDAEAADRFASCLEGAVRACWTPALPRA